MLITREAHYEVGSGGEQRGGSAGGEGGARKRVVRTRTARLELTSMGQASLPGWMEHRQLPRASEPVPISSSTDSDLADGGSEGRQVSLWCDPALVLQARQESATHLLRGMVALEMSLQVSCGVEDSVGKHSVLGWRSVVHVGAHLSIPELLPVQARRPSHDSTLPSRPQEQAPICDSIEATAGDYVGSGLILRLELVSSPNEKRLT